ncbi:MAG: MinD/ParA family protein, partial [bacterium]
AEELRRQRGYPAPQIPKAHIITVTSGKGGVGKSNFALNFSLCLSFLGKRVLLVDADANLANLDLLLGIRPSGNLGHIVRGEKGLDEVLIRISSHLDFLPAASGDATLFGWEEETHRRLKESFTALEQEYPFIVVDTGAGLTPIIISYAASADDLVVVTQNEPTAVADAYALVKMVVRSNPTARIHILVNRTRSPEEGYDLFDRLNLVSHNFLQVDLQFLGSLPEDPKVGEAVAAQAPFVKLFPHSSASVAVKMIVRRLFYSTVSSTSPPHISWWEKLVHILKGQSDEKS